MRVHEHRALSREATAAGPALSLVQQVQRASLIQRSLLPDLSAPQGDFRLAGLYCPCESLGGDFYDLSQARGRAVLLVSDVMGHGVEAALTTMLLKAVFQEAAAESSSPGEILGEMNERLHRNVPAKEFVAAAVVTLELDSSRVLCANAGLPHPFVLRAGGGRVDEVEIDGLPLGLFGSGSHSGYDTRLLNLAAGDVLLIASDGIGSIANDGDECFEDGRMAQVLAELAGQDGEHVLVRLIEAAAGFSHGRPFEDDVNLVTVTRSPCSGRGRAGAPRGVEH